MSNNNNDAVLEAEQQLISSLNGYTSSIKNAKTDELISKLQSLTRELCLSIEEHKLNSYFDKEYMSYLSNKIRISDMFGAKVSGILESIVKGDTRLISQDVSQDISRDTSHDASIEDLVPYFTDTTKPQSIVYSISAQTFIDSIVESYESDKSIVNQFLCDFFRQTIRANGNTYRSIDDLFAIMSESNYKTQICSNMNSNTIDAIDAKQKQLSSFMLMLLLTCQSSHYLSYVYPYKVLEHLRKLDNHNKYVMTDTEQGFNTTNLFTSDPISDIMADRSPEIGCIIESSYKILDVETATKLCSIKAETIFTERSDRCLIKYTVIPCNVDKQSAKN
jgi:hypothetical protein